MTNVISCYCKEEVVELQFWSLPTLGAMDILNNRLLDLMLLGNGFAFWSASLLPPFFPPLSLFFSFSLGGQENQRKPA